MILASAICILGFAQNALADNSGTFTSAVKDTGHASNFSTLSYIKTTPANTTLTVDVRAGNTSSPDETWTSWQTDISNGGSIAALDGNRYVQYRANFSTTDVNVTPSLDDVTFNYSSYPTSTNTLLSSVYDTNDSDNNLSKIQWEEILPTNTDIKFQIRTSQDGTNWGNWCGPDDGISSSCSTSTYFTDKNGNETIDDTQKDGADDRYFQYKTFLSSTDGLRTPTLSDVTVSYAYIIPPTVTTGTATNKTSTTVTLSSTISTSGGENPQRIIEYGTQSGNYTSNCNQGTGTGEYSCNLTNLQSETTYYYRAKAQNSGGTSYGNEQSFTTLPSSITIESPDTTKVGSAYDEGYLSLIAGSLSETSQATTNTSIILTNPISSTTIPAFTNITKTAGGNFNMSQFISNNVTSQVLVEDSNTKGAIKIGIDGTGLTFSNAITLSINVGNTYNGQKLYVKYQNENESTWNDLTTCTISNGKCTFTTTHATTYTVDDEGHAVGTEGNNITTNIQQIITLNCGPTLSLGNIIPGTPVSNTATCTTTTNAEQGFALSVKRDDASGTMNHADGDYISDKSAWNPDTPNGATWTGIGLAFRLRQTGTDTNLYNSTYWGADDTQDNAKYAGFPEDYAIIGQTSAYYPTTVTSVIEAKLDVPNTQKSGEYDGTVTVQATGKP